jgi:hypothetical protein
LLSSTEDWRHVTAAVFLLFRAMGEEGAEWLNVFLTFPAISSPRW